MNHRPFTPEWAQALREAIEQDAHYRHIAARWTWAVALVLDAAPEMGYAKPVAVELQLDRGRCNGAAIRSPEALTAPFILRAPYAIWKSVVRGELDPLAAVTRGRIAVHGSLFTLLLHAKSAVALVVCARAVPTRFPDEALAD